MINSSILFSTKDWLFYSLFTFLSLQRYQQAPGSAPPGRGAPPPYPGAPSGGPSHGYGEGRGHYNRRGGAGPDGRGPDPRAPDPRGGRGPSQGDRRSWAPPHSGGQRYEPN